MRFGSHAILFGLLAAGCGQSREAVSTTPPSGSAPAPSPPIENDAGGADAAAPAPAVAAADDWPSRVIYLALPDRFANGDPSNDRSGSPDCFDRTSPKGHHGGDLAGLRQHRGYLSELGVTALWVTPVVRQAPDRCGSYHGYWADYADPSDLGLAPTLGGAADLDGLIADLHAAKILFMLDMVVNHAGTGAKILTQHPDWFHDPATCAKLGDPVVTCPLSRLPDFAQEKTEVAAYASAMSTAWASRFAIDGIRMDTVKHVPIPYWKTSWWPAMRAARGDLFVVGEVLDGSGGGALAPFLDAGFPSLFAYPLYYAFTDAFAKSGSLDAVAVKLADSVTTLGIERTRLLTTFIDNHDQPRFATQSQGTPDSEMARRLRLALAALFTVPGIPQLYYGDELGFFGTDNRADMPSWAFSAQTRGGTHDSTLPGADVTFAWVQKLIKTRAAHPALSAGSYVELFRPNGGSVNVLAFSRASASGDRVLVAFNGGDAPASTAVTMAGFADGTTLSELLGGGAPSAVKIANGSVKLDLPAKCAAAYAP